VGGHVSAIRIWLELLSAALLNLLYDESEDVNDGAIVTTLVECWTR